MLHAGIDMHKEFLMVTVLDEEGGEVVSPRRIPTSGLCIEEFFGEFAPEEITAVLEAGPNWYWLCDQLDELGIQNRLAHPLKTKAIASARIKTDKIDSHTLADLSRADLIAESYKPDIKTRYLRELMRGRSFMVNLRTGLKNRVHSILAKVNVKNPYSDLFGIGGMGFLASLALPGVYRDSLDSYLEVIESLNGEIKGAEKKAARALEGSPEARLLSTIPGVGLITSLMITAEMGDVSRFGSHRQLCSFAGLVPSTWQSGGTTRHGRITRQGSRWLRFALVEACRHAVARPGPLADFYGRLAKRKGKSTAKVAAARKLGTYVYYMLRDGKDYRELICFLNGERG